TATATPSPTDTPQPSPTYTPTPDRTVTALAALALTQAAAPPTPDMTQTLAACQFEYIVVAPEDLDVPPEVVPRNYTNPRLVAANQTFEFELVLKNTGACDW